MPNYEVTIHLNSISYEIEADTEDEAIEQASQIVYDETMYDLLKWADYEAKEITEDNNG